MSRRMKNPPVFYTVVQVQHNALLSLGSYIVAIQDRMRKEGFPDFRKQVQRQFNLTLNGDASQQNPPGPVLSEEVSSFAFSNMSSTNGFVLQPTSFVYHTTEYETFEQFLSQVALGLSILNEAVGGIDYTERLGLRYVDAVTLSGEESIKDYLAPELLGLPWSLKRQQRDAKFGYTFNESLLIEAGVGQVVSRVVVQSGRVAFPPDIAVLTLKVADRLAQYEGEHAIIDTDASVTERVPFAEDLVQRRLSALHGLIEQAFHGSVTDSALAKWRGEGQL